MTSSCSPPWRSNSIGRARVEGGPPAEGEARVRRVADERVPEAEASRDLRIALDELGEPFHAWGRPPHPPRRRGRRRGRRETPGQNRGPAEKRPVGAVQPVDAACQPPLRPSRAARPLRAVPCGARGDELLKEQRVAAGTGGDRVGLLVGDLRAGRTNERLGVVGRERLEPHGHRGHGRRAVGGGEAARDGPPRRADEPGVRRQVPAEVAEELGRGLVHPVGVLEEERRGPRQQALEQGLDGAVEAGAAERRLELVHLTGRGDRDVERNREQGEPRHELGRDVVEATAEHARRRGHASRRRTPTTSRRSSRKRSRASRTRIARRHRARPSYPRVRAELLEQPRLPDPASPTSSTSVPKPMRTGPSARRSSAARASRRRAAHAGPGRPASPRPRPRRTVRPPRTCPSARTPADASTAERRARDRSRTPAVARTCEGRARAMSRAASAAVSPRIVYVRRNGAPTSPANTRPRFTPARSGSGGESSNDRAKRAKHPLLVVLGRLGRAGDEDDPAAVGDRCRSRGSRRRSGRPRPGRLG